MEDYWNTFIGIFEEEAANIEAAAEEEKDGREKKGRVEWLLQGTLSGRDRED